MTRTTVELDPAKLEAARRVLGARTASETVDRALNAVLAMAARRRTVERLQQMDGLELDVPQVTDAAWRSQPDS